MLHISAQDVANLVSPADAVKCIHETLAAGFDPAQDFARDAKPVPGGEFLLMPSASTAGFGVKLVSVADPDPNFTGPRIQGTYVLFDGATLAPHATIDGVALTNLRTPAASLAGVRDFLADSPAPLSAVVIGTGPQGRWHARTLEDMLRGTREVAITFASRTRPADLDRWVRMGSPEAAAALSTADVIITTTTSTTPVISRKDISDTAIVVAVGSHSPQARELAADILADATVIVEDKATALREAGDVVLAIEDSALSGEDLVEIKDVLCQRSTVSLKAPIVFKTTGMAWQDLVIAQLIAQRYAH
ncbi:ornithine cyclodeaminase family protein [Corynebacterium lizhenjunii]|uniref:Ornithine cyclodeaminase family protein n=1 Tax=Corynebacterium lizhenjunii TaxID=2709394 RepID=A0A7T0KFR5_9CORY|nr:ornithine cyclodeaminase family protein [Corynebacterium lizhenjunii]QPK79940.1 ornithine cyclodeaminase family protein [Corynebacterium lizhenjunii]